MESPILCLPLPQHLEGIDGSARSDVMVSATHGITRDFFAETPTRDPLLLTERLASSALSITTRWRVATQPGPAASGSSERQIEYDGYFGVQRLTEADPLVSLGEATLVVYYRLMLDSLRGHSLSAVELADLHGAFEATVSILTGTLASAPMDPADPPSPAGAPPGTSVDAMLRWKLGHHTFFILIQALIIVHARLAAALELRRLPQAQEAFSLATRLWRGTAAAFRYTGDFTAEDYEQIVRPSMRPPFLKDGFSGFFSADHAYLLRAIKSLQPILQELPPELEQEHQSYLRALDAAYEAHAFVCERFVGEGKSLKGSLKDPYASAPTVIRRDLKSRALAGAGGRSVS